MVWPTLGSRTAKEQELDSSSEQRRLGSQHAGRSTTLLELFQLTHCQDSVVLLAVAAANNMSVVSTSFMSTS